MSLSKLKSKGFTLIELMIVVAIIGILAAVAVPKFADLVTKSKEASVKGSLGAVRSAVSIYYGDTEGNYPGNLFEGLTYGNRYMPAIGGVPSLGIFDLPKNNAGNPGHGYGNVDASGEVTQDIANFTEDGNALHFNTNTGDLYVFCSHNDTKGNKWTSY